MKQSPLFTRTLSRRIHRQRIVRRQPRETSRSNSIGAASWRIPIFVDRLDVGAVYNLAFAPWAIAPVDAIGRVSADLAAVGFLGDNRGGEDGTDCTGGNGGGEGVAKEDGGVAEGGVGCVGAGDVVDVRDVLPRISALI